jgi:hypothetical protein
MAATTGDACTNYRCADWGADSEGVQARSRTITLRVIPSSSKSSKMPLYHIMMMERCPVCQQGTLRIIAAITEGKPSHVPWFFNKLISLYKSRRRSAVERRPGECPQLQEGFSCIPYITAKSASWVSGLF